MNKNKIAVIGTGTAGIMSLSHCLAHLDNTWEVYSIFDPSKPILGIGESTSTQIPENLFNSIGFNLNDIEHSDLDATLKLGVKFSNWRKQDFYSHMMVPRYGIHFNNFKLRDYSFKKFKEIFNSRFKEIHGEVTKVSNKDTCVEVIVNNNIEEFDFVIDCGGWPVDYTEYNYSKSIPVNTCLVNMIPESGDWNYTHHIATPDGWMFGIPLQSRQGWGYLYNKDITSKEDAVKNMSTFFKETDFDIDNLKEFNFKSYRAKKYIDGRIVKNGNRALFYEPIEALSGYFYDQVLRYFFDYLQLKYTEDGVNAEIDILANNIELGIAFLYHGGSTYNTKFWNHASSISKEKLSTDDYWKHTVQKITDLKQSHSGGFGYMGVGAFTMKSWLDFEKNLNYNIFT
jgi:hypothetical protein